MNNTITENIEEGLVQQKESIKLVKNSKGYTWEIRLVADKKLEAEEQRLYELNERMKKTYPNPTIQMKGGEE